MFVFMCICVHMCVCVCVSGHVHMHVCEWACTYACVCEWACAHVRVCVCVWVGLCPRACVCVWVGLCRRERRGEAGVTCEYSGLAEKDYESHEHYCIYFEVLFYLLRLTDKAANCYEPSSRWICSLFCQLWHWISRLLMYRLLVWSAAALLHTPRNTNRWIEWTPYHSGVWGVKFFYLMAVTLRYIAFKYFTATLLQGVVCFRSTPSSVWVPQAGFCLRGCPLSVDGDPIANHQFKLQAGCYGFRLHNKS